MVTGEVDHGDLLSFWINRTEVCVMTEVDGKTETFKGHCLKEIAVP